MRRIFCNTPPETPESILPESDAGAVTSTSGGGASSARQAPPAQHYDATEIRCEFCESRVTRAKGEVLELGKRARKMRDTELELEAANRTIQQLEQRITELTPAPPAAKRSLIQW